MANQAILLLIISVIGIVAAIVAAVASVLELRKCRDDAVNPGDAELTKSYLTAVRMMSEDVPDKLYDANGREYVKLVGWMGDYVFMSKSDWETIGRSVFSKVR